MKKVNMIELIQTVILLLFLIVISIYHISYDNYLGISEKNWSVIWAVAENGLLLTLVIIVNSLITGVVKIVCKWVLIPYFILKLVYHISCYSGFYLVSPRFWEIVWTLALIELIVIGLIYCVYLINKR